MADNILDLPQELIVDVIKRVDYSGLVALRRVCRRTKRIVDDDACRITAIRQIFFSEITIGDPSLQIEVENAKPPIFFLQHSDVIQKYWRQKDHTLVLYVFTRKIENFPEFLNQFRAMINNCPIDSFMFYSHHRLWISLFARFMEGLNVKTRSIYQQSSKQWSRAMQTVDLLHLNTAKIGINTTMEEKLQMADAVDSLVIMPEYQEDSLDIAVFVMKVLPLIDKKVYLYARVFKGAARRLRKEGRTMAGKMNFSIDVAPRSRNGDLEIWHDGVERRRIPM